MNGLIKITKIRLFLSYSAALAYCLSCVDLVVLCSKVDLNRKLCTLCKSRRAPLTLISNGESQRSRRKSYLPSCTIACKPYGTAEINFTSDAEYLELYDLSKSTDLWHNNKGVVNTSLEFISYKKHFCIFCRQRKRKTPELVGVLAGMFSVNSGTRIIRTRKGQAIVSVLFGGHGHMHVLSVLRQKQTF